MTFAPDRKVELCSSGTSALTVALMALGVKGNVIVPAFTFAATATAVELAGCTPLICDVEVDYWELDPHLVEKELDRQNANAVVHVRPFGLCRDLHAMQSICDRFNIPLIIDAAAALGGRLPNGTFAGSQGTAEVFSMHATKTFGIGEGGAVFAKPDMALAVRAAANFGLRDGVPRAAGMNAKMNEFSAAVGLAMLDVVEAHIARRQQIAERYSTLCRRMDWSVPRSPGLPPWPIYPALLPDGSDTAALVDALGKKGLEARRYYYPTLDRMARYGSYASARPIRAQSISERMICLPMYSDMSEEELDEIERICLSTK